MPALPKTWVQASGVPGARQGLPHANCKTKHESSRAGKLLPAVSLGMVFPVLPLRFLACCLPLCLPFLTSF
uniref:Uncharacterized protein n=1 Tax=Bubo bubo TaxID=30461 RepID=A0A8C0EI43_BUBBB